MNTSRWMRKNSEKILDVDHRHVNSLIVSFSLSPTPEQIWGGTQKQNLLFYIKLILVSGFNLWFFCSSVTWTKFILLSNLFWGGKTPTTPLRPCFRAGETPASLGVSAWGGVCVWTRLSWIYSTNDTWLSMKMKRWILQRGCAILLLSGWEREKGRRREGLSLVSFQELSPTTFCWRRIRKPKLLQDICLKAALKTQTVKCLVFVSPATLNEASKNSCTKHFPYFAHILSVKP